MQRDMDQVCVIVVVVVATILLCMGYVEMTKMNKFRPHTSSTCGRKGDIKEKDETVSAKRAHHHHPNQTGQKPNHHLKMEEEWMNTDVNCKHKEMTQDEERLKQLYEWTLAEDSSANKQFTDYAKSYDKMHMKHAANVRPYGPRTTQVRNALGSKNRGVPGYMDTVRQTLDKCSGKTGEIVKFEKECVAFGGSDQYIQARADSNQACTM